MQNRVYYIDSDCGDNQNDGSSPDRPIRDEAGRSFLPGDTILFKRGNILRRPLLACSGEPGHPIIYGSYGEGNLPVFMGSVELDAEGDWQEEFPNIWLCRSVLPSEACNLIFNGGESCGELRWQVKDLRRQGQWHDTRIGWSNDEDGDAAGHADEPGFLYLYSEGNPGRRYLGIECAVYGGRRLAAGERHIVFEDLAFRNAGVHGYQQIRAKGIVIRRCEFSFIGGAVWSRKRRIRFGNAVELWEDAADITVEECVFDNIYDSGVTHQGTDSSGTPRNIRFTGNLFLRCGMAAYECRGPAAENVLFERNVCVDTGGGFAPQGEPAPRRSEIYPEPMGHHVFIWRIGKGSQTGKVCLLDNVFCGAPQGAAIYSMIDPEDERRFIIDRNVYCHCGGELLFRMNGRNYSMEKFALYQRHTGHDSHSVLLSRYAAIAYGKSYRLGGETERDTLS